MRQTSKPTARERIRRMLCGLLLLLPVSGGASGAEIIDRLLAIVDGQVVTLGDLERYRALAELFGDAVPDDRDALLEAVIEDRLIDAQVAQFPGIRVSSEAVSAYIAQLENTGGFPAGVLSEAVRARLARAQYFDLRFRQFVQATESEIAAYYERVFVPEARSRGLEPVPPLDEVREMVRVNVSAEKTEREIAQWVESLYRRSEVEVVE